MLAWLVTGLGRSGRFTKESKGKVEPSKPRRSRLWPPPADTLNLTTGVLTRARRSLAHECMQQRVNDAVVTDAIADLTRGMGGGGDDLAATEPQHTLGSMDTLNVDLWDSCFRWDKWRSQGPIEQAPTFENTHPVVTLPLTVACPLLEMPVHLEGLYTDWSVARAGWAVLVPNRFLSASSFHTGCTPSWTHGDVIGEGVNLGTGRKMILVNLGWCDKEIHMEENDVRVAGGPEERAIGSEGGHGYGWLHQQLCQGSNAVVASLADGNMNVDEPGGTQESTARTPFPNVSSYLPDYMSTTSPFVHAKARDV